MAAALGVPVSAVTIKSVTVASGRRLGESDARQLSASSAVKVSYLVTSSATASSVTTSIKNSAASLTNNLNAVGGFSATVGSASIDTSTPSPTAAPVYNAYVVATPNSCFSGSETVALESGEVKFISDVTVGDRVLAASAAGKTLYSDVVFVPHGANKESAVFMHITTESGRDVKMTQSHIIPAGVCGSSLPLVYASKVTVGDCVLTVSGEEKVSSVESVRGEGVYTIVTKEEFIVVNGIVASPFGANHMMANMYYNIHRFAFTIAPTLLATNLFHSINEGLGLFAIFFGSV